MCSLYRHLSFQHGTCRRVEYAKPITIGAGVWVGGSAVICPGVKNIDRSIIGAGSVVTKEIPANVFAAGNPCRVIRELEQEKLIATFFIQK